MLPNWAKNNLPEAAQKLYAVAYETALANPYAVPENQIEQKNHHEHAQEQAWKALNQYYVLKNGQWVQK